MAFRRAPSHLPIEKRDDWIHTMELFLFHHNIQSLDVQQTVSSSKLQRKHMMQMKFHDMISMMALMTIACGASTSTIFKT